MKLKIYVRSDEESYSPKQTDLYLKILEKLSSNKLKCEFRKIFPPHDKVAEIIFIGHYDKKRLVQISAELSIDGHVVSYSDVLEKFSSALKYKKDVGQIALFEYDDKLQNLLDNTLGLESVLQDIKESLN